MIYYTPEPLELLSQGEGTQSIMLELPSGGHIVAQPYEFNKLKIMAIVSTDPMDYMNSKFQPGNIISLETKIQSL